MFGGIPRIWVCLRCVGFCGSRCRFLPGTLRRVSPANPALCEAGGSHVVDEFLRGAFDGDAEFDLVAGFLAVFVGVPGGAFVAVPFPAFGCASAFVDAFGADGLVAHSGWTVKLARLPRDTVRGTSIRWSMWERWLILMPPTFSRPKVMSGSR